MSPMAMITFTSDFGSRYAAAVRGVLVAGTDERIIDVTHALPRYSTRGAAFWVDQLLREYPAGVHLIAADPSRGTATDTVIGVVGEHHLVGPDSGVCWPVSQTLARRTGAAPTWYRHRGEPCSFPTRDIRAPLAVALAAEPSATLERCDRIDGPTPLDLPEGAVTATAATGEVITIDRFGNVITSIPARYIEANVGVPVVVDGSVGVVQDPHVPPTGDALVVTAGEHGRVELVLAGGSAADRLELGPGDQLHIERA